MVRNLAALCLVSVALTAQTPTPPLADFIAFAVNDAAAGFVQSKQRAADGGFDYGAYLTDCYYGDRDTTLGARVACFVSPDLPLNGSSLRDAVQNALPPGFQPEAAVLDGQYSWIKDGKIEVSLDTSVAGTSLMVEDIRPL